MLEPKGQFWFEHWGSALEVAPGSCSPLSGVTTNSSAALSGAHAAGGPGAHAGLPTSQTVTGDEDNINIYKNVSNKI